MASVDETREERVKRIREIREAVRHGQYRVGPASLAETLLSVDAGSATGGDQAVRARCG